MDVKRKIPHEQKNVDDGLPTDAVVEDRNLITGSGPGASFRFSLAIAAKLVGVERAKGVAPPLMLV